MVWARWFVTAAALLLEEIAVVLAIVFAIITVAFLGWLLFTLAVYALPFAAGWAAGAFAYDHGAGMFGAVLTGFGAAFLALFLGHFLLALIRTPWLRGLILLAFAAPAAVAGYYAVSGVIAHTDAGPGWVQAFALIGAAIIGGVAWERLAATTTDAAAVPAQSYAGAGR